MRELKLLNIKKHDIIGIRYENHVSNENLDVLFNTESLKINDEKEDEVKIYINFKYLMLVNDYHNIYVVTKDSRIDVTEKINKIYYDFFKAVRSLMPNHKGRENKHYFIKTVESDHLRVKYNNDDKTYDLSLVIENINNQLSFWGRLKLAYYTLMGVEQQPKNIKIEKTEFELFNNKLMNDSYIQNSR